MFLVNGIQSAINDVQSWLKRVRGFELPAMGRSQFNFRREVVSPQIFARYASWGQFAGRLKLLPVNEDLLREIFQPMQKEKIVQIAKRLGETTGREEILFLYQQVNEQTVLECMDVWIGHFDACKHQYDGKTHFYTVHHGVNLNFSLFTKEYLSGLIQSTIPRMVNFQKVSPNALTFSFDMP